MKLTDSWTAPDQARFEQLYALGTAGADDDAKLVSLTDEMLALAVLHGAATQMTIECDSMGISPWNRQRKGLAGADVHELTGKVEHVGFSWARVAPHRAQAMQEDPVTRATQAFTERLLNEDPLLPDAPKSAPVAGSMGCSHVNRMLRLLKHSHHTLDTFDSRLNIAVA